MDNPTFQLHEGDEERYELTHRTQQTLFPATLARIMGPTTDDKAEELAEMFGYELITDGEDRVLVVEGETHNLPRLPTWPLVWAQIAPHILKGMSHEEVDPNQIAVSEVARAYLYWRTRGLVDPSAWDAAFALAKAEETAEEAPAPEPEEESYGPSVRFVGAAVEMKTGTTLSSIVQ